jgi:hypothetical protein
MKKGILALALALSILSCKREEVEPTIGEPIRTIMSVPYDTIHVCAPIITEKSELNGVWLETDRTYSDPISLDFDLNLFTYNHVNDLRVYRSKCTVLNENTLNFNGSDYFSNRSDEYTYFVTGFNQGDTMTVYSSHLTKFFIKQ